MISSQGGEGSWIDVGFGMLLFFLEEIFVIQKTLELYRFYR